MTEFGRRSGGGRRIEARGKLPLPAVVSTLRESVTAEVIDLSLTGVRFNGSHLPAPGAFVSLRIDKLDGPRSLAPVCEMSSSSCALQGHWRRRAAIDGIVDRNG